jgi:hypothetical protein
MEENEAGTILAPEEQGSARFNPMARIRSLRKREIELVGYASGPLYKIALKGMKS